MVAMQRAAECAGLAHLDPSTHLSPVQHYNILNGTTVGMLYREAGRSYRGFRMLGKRDEDDALPEREQS